MSFHGLMPGNCQGLFRASVAHLKYVKAVVQRYVLSDDNALKSIDNAFLSVVTARRKVLREVRARASGSSLGECASTNSKP